MLRLNSQIDEEIDNLTKLGQQHNIDVSNCTEIGHVAQKKAVTILDNATSCVMGDIANVTHEFQHVHHKLNKAMVLLSNFTVATSLCVTNLNSSSVDKGICIFNVSLQSMAIKMPLCSTAICLL